MTQEASEHIVKDVIKEMKVEMINDPILWICVIGMSISLLLLTASWVSKALASDRRAIRRNKRKSTKEFMQRHCNNAYELPVVETVWDQGADVNEFASAMVCKNTTLDASNVETHGYTESMKKKIDEVLDDRYDDVAKNSSISFGGESGCCDPFARRGYDIEDDLSNGSTTKFKHISVESSFEGLSYTSKENEVSPQHELKRHEQLIPDNPVILDDAFFTSSVAQHEAPTDLHTDIDARLDESNDDEDNKPKL